MDIESKTYIGTKTLKAWPMTRGEYNNYRGWTPPEGEDQTVPGYLVEYEPDGNPNVAGHEGYVSWSPASAFEGSYKPASAFEGSYKPANNFYERLLIEADELEDRLAKLRAFLDSNEYTLLPAGDRDLLQDQYHFMHGYSKIVNARIDRHNALQQAAPADGGPEADEPPAGEDTVAVDVGTDSLTADAGTDTGLAAPTTDTTQS